MRGGAQSELAANILFFLLETFNVFFLKKLGSYLKANTDEGIYPLLKWDRLNSHLPTYKILLAWLGKAKVLFMSYLLLLKALLQSRVKLSTSPLRGRRRCCTRSPRKKFYFQ